MKRVIALCTGAVITGAALTACGSSEPAATPAKGGVVNGMIPDQTTFRDELIAASLPQDEATALIEQNGYTWRLGTIDGEPQAVTMDYRDDRLTLTVDAGIVTDATWG
jgi:hypothetical protein